MPDPKTTTLDLREWINRNRVAKPTSATIASGPSPTLTSTSLMFLLVWGRTSTGIFPHLKEGVTSSSNAASVTSVSASASSNEPPFRGKPN